MSGQKYSIAAELPVRILLIERFVYGVL